MGATAWNTQSRWWNCTWGWCGGAPQLL